MSMFCQKIIIGQKNKKEKIFFHSICKAFPKKYQFRDKNIFLTLMLSNNQRIKN